MSDQGRRSLPAANPVPASIPTNTSSHRQHTEHKENTSTGAGRQHNATNLSDNREEKIRSNHLRLVLKPLPPEELEEMKALTKSRLPVSHTRPSLAVCLQRFYRVVLKDWCSNVCLSSHSLSELCWVNSDSVGCPAQSCTQPQVERKRPSIRLKMKPIKEEIKEELKETTTFDHLERSESTKKPPAIDPRDEYPLTYHSLEFMPYNPLPDHLEKVVFPYRNDPLANYDDPYWPSKGSCLELVQEVRENPQIANFPGTFLPPATRGAE